MDQRRPAPSGGDPAVMAEYFETMRQFLETQERVMAAYMTGEAAGVVPARCRAPRTAQALPMPRSADPVAATPVIAAEPGSDAVAPGRRAAAGRRPAPPRR